MTKRSARQKRKQTQTKRKWWQSKGLTIFLLIVFIGLSVSVAKELVRRVEMRYEIDQLQADVNRLRERNSSMEQLIGVLNTSNSQEKQARMKLGLQESGETTVILENRKSDDTIELPDSDKIRYIPVSTYESNPEKWWNYFKDKSNNNL